MNTGWPNLALQKHSSLPLHLLTQGATTVEVLTTDPDGEVLHSNAASTGCLTVLAHPDLSRIGDQFCWPLMSGRALDLSRLTPLFQSVSGAPSRALEDIRLSRSPLMLKSTVTGIELSSEGDRIRFELEGRPVFGRENVSHKLLQRGVILTLGKYVALMLRGTPAPITAKPIPELLGVSPEMRRVWDELVRIASLNLPVLLTGESGVGKELVARAIHQHSARMGQQFIAVNLAAMTAGTATAQLFGYAKGAFTGAEARRQGYFGEAEGGTLFLDEIGETPVEVQPMLLRAIESGEIQPLGLPPRASNVRVVSATDANLEDLVAAGRFRSALLHRLRATHIAIPPLRARREDIPILLLHFLREALPRFSALARLDSSQEGAPPWLQLQTILALLRYPWPGNVRELRNVAYELAVGSHAQSRASIPTWLETRLEQLEQVGASLRPHDFSTPLSEPTVSDRLAKEGSKDSFKDSSKEVRELASQKHTQKPAQISPDLLKTTLEQHDWQIGISAQTLGISRNSLYALMREHGIVHAAGLPATEILEAAAAEGSNDPARLAARLRVSERGLLLRMRTLGLVL